MEAGNTEDEKERKKGRSQFHSEGERKMITTFRRLTFLLAIAFALLTQGCGSEEDAPPAFPAFRNEQVKKFNEFATSLRAKGLPQEDFRKQIQEYAQTKLLKEFFDYRKTEEGKKAEEDVDRESLVVAIQLAEDEKAVEQVLQFERAAEKSLNLKLFAAEQYARTRNSEKAKTLVNAVLKESETKFPDIHQEAKTTLFRVAPEGLVFPEFPEWAKDTEGKPLRVADYRGKLLLIDFWATWCPPCKDEVPNLAAAYGKYREKGFEVIGISFDYSEKEFRDFVKNMKMTWREYYDGLGWDNKVGKVYGIGAIPAMYLLDKEGKVISGNARGPRLEEILKKYLGGEE
jgi:thiol-disulfide isomerase/thioredoxin